MERIRYADDLPICYEVASIPLHIVESFDKTDITNNFFKTLQDNDMKIGKSQQIISAKKISKEIADYLKVKAGSAILNLTQVSYLESGEAFEYVLSQYVSDRFEFYLER
jgi:GntR family transcriptional regulator